MKKMFRPYNPGHLLLPPSIEEWVPENHLARFTNDTVEQMDLGDYECVRTGVSRVSPVSSGHVA